MTRASTRTGRKATARASAVLPHVHSFAPLVTTTSRVLILGSMPGVASLQAQQYYAHPRNAMWSILAPLIGVSSTAPYDERVAALLRTGLAMWDVAGSCVRPGSLDAAIDDDSVVPNDLPTLLRDHPTVTCICLNGGKAAALFRRHVAAALPGPDRRAVVVHALPSTSPAHAAASHADKSARWHAVLREHV